MADNFFYENGQRRMPSPNFKAKTSVLYPISFNHLALMAYHPDRTIEEIVLFEKLVVLNRLSKRKYITYPLAWLLRDLHIKRERFETALTALQKAGIVSVEIPGRGKRNKYTLNHNKIIDALPFIYEMPDDESERKLFLKELEDFYTYYISARYRSTNQDQSIPDEIYSGRFSLAASETRNTKDKNVDEVE